MSARRKVCVVTGSRADYGLLRGVIRGIAADPDLQLQLVATGMHLSPEFGLTYREIESDGFELAGRVQMLLSGDTPAAIAKSLGLGVIGFADELERLRPDLLVVLGDRFEVLAAVQAALVARIPVAHIHGGETSEHSFDEGIRHAITKLSQWHFVAAEAYRQRVIQMGEAPERVFNFGAPGLDRLAEMQWLAPEALSERLGMPLGRPFFLVTYHPVTLSEVPPEAPLRELLAALEEFPDATIVITHPNADTGGRSMVPVIEAFVARHERARAFVSLGHELYLNAMRHADVVLGNSSSGLIEAPALGRPTVNVGERQKGRLKASSVIDCEEAAPRIAAAIRTALSPEFRAAMSGARALYRSANASSAIVSQLKAPLPPVQKRFFDIAHGN